MENESTVTDLVLIQNEVALQEPAIEKLVINDPASMEEAARLVALLKHADSVAEDLRKEEVGPLNETVKAINAKYKLVTSKIGALLLKLNGGMGEYTRRVREEEEARRREAEKAQRKAEEAARKAIEQGKPVPAAPAPPPPIVEQPRKTETAFGTVAMTSVWKWDLIDLDKVPRKYLALNEALVTKLVKAGERNIPGVRIYETFTSTSRKG